MVAAFDDQEKNAKLSLRQTEILAKLQSIVNNIASDSAEPYVLLSSLTQVPCTQRTTAGTLCRHSTPSMDGLCWSPPPDLPTRARSVISSPSRTTCAIGEDLPLYFRAAR